MNASCDLRDVVAEMREYAQAHPFNGDGPPDPRCGFPLVDEGCVRQFEFQGYTLHITLSLDSYPSRGKTLWHLSVGRDQGKVPVAEDITMAILDAFLGREGIARLPPEAFPPIMRNIHQFIQEAHP